MTSGFGKVILLGEHAVVYGHAALAGAVSLRVAARVEPAERSTLEVPAWNLRTEVGAGGQPAAALAALVEANCDDGEAWRVTVSATLPSRAGLGSSAALCVAVTRALACAHRNAIDAADVEARASHGERCFHETPSGVDVAVATRGGLGLFRTQGGLAPIDAQPISIVVGLTGEPRSTSDLVARVAAARERDRSGTDANLTRLGELAETGARACRTDERDAVLGEFFQEAQTILSALGVSSSGINEMVNTAQSAGALGAKLTGAGGGGAVIAIGPGREDDIAKAWRALGRESFVTRVGVVPNEDNK